MCYVCHIINYFYYEEFVKKPSHNSCIDMASPLCVPSYAIEEHKVDYPKNISVYNSYII